MQSTTSCLRFVPVIVVPSALLLTVLGCDRQLDASRPNAPDGGSKLDASPPDASDGDTLPSPAALYCQQSDALLLAWVRSCLKPKCKSPETCSWYLEDDELLAALERAPCSTVLPFLEDGSIEFDAELAKECLELETHRTEACRAEVPGVCSPFRGKLEVGQACYPLGSPTINPCASGYCDTAETCPGVCRDAAGYKDPCGSAHPDRLHCAQPFHCSDDDAACERKFQRPDTPCKSHAECPVTHTCWGSADNEERRCGPPTTSRVPDELGVCPVSSRLHGRQFSCVPGFQYGERASQCYSQDDCSANSSCIDYGDGQSCFLNQPDEGQHCIDLYDCVDDLQCVYYADVAVIGTCETPKKRGDECYYDSREECEAPARCINEVCAVVDSLPRYEACFDTSECATEDECLDGQCVARYQPLGDTCRVDEECWGPLSCYDGSCREQQAQGGSCDTDSDCNRGLRCEESACSPCPQGVCDVGEGEKCEGHSNCSSGLYCLAGYCRDSPEPGEPCGTFICAPGTECWNDVCEPLPRDLGKACRGHSSCAAGLRCIDRVCQVARQLGDQCREGECARGMDCGPVRAAGPVSRRCVARGSADTLCLEGGKCLPGLECVKSRCKPKGGICSTHEDCGTGLLCSRYHTCVPIQAYGTVCDEWSHSGHCALDARCAEGPDAPMGVARCLKAGAECRRQ